MGTRTTFTYLAKIVLFLNRNSSRVQNSCIAKARVATTEPESFNFWPGRLSKIYKNTIQTFLPIERHNFFCSSTDFLQIGTCTAQKPYFSFLTRGQSKPINFSRKLSFEVGIMNPQGFYSQHTIVKNVNLPSFIFRSNDLLKNCRPIFWRHLLYMKINHFLCLLRGPKNWYCTRLQFKSRLTLLLFAIKHCY